MKSKKKKTTLLCIVLKKNQYFVGFFFYLKIHSSGLKLFIIHLNTYIISSNLACEVYINGKRLFRHITLHVLVC